LVISDLDLPTLAATLLSVALLPISFLIADMPGPFPWGYRSHVVNVVYDSYFFFGVRDIDGLDAVHPQFFMRPISSFAGNDFEFVVSAGRNLDWLLQAVFFD